jgi:hypothetical protein
MHVAMLELRPDEKSATGVRGRALKEFLERHGHFVEVLFAPAEYAATFQRYRLSPLARISRRLSGRRNLPHLWDYVADAFEPLLRRVRYDAVIGRGQEAGYVLTRDLPGLKILDIANIFFLESYYAASPNLDEVEETFEKEMKLFGSADYILTHHEILTAYFLKEVGGRGNFSQRVVTVRMGCEPASACAQFSPEPRIVYAGSYYYMQDPYLLAQITRLSPFPIECYGPTDPNRPFLPSHLVYKGYCPQLDFLARYQAGLITVSRDSLRQHSPSTKFPYYFAHGLPVLFPEWMKEGHTYPDCALAFDEATFPQQASALAERTRWERMSRAARDLARELSWDKTLRPLSAILSAGG